MCDITKSRKGDKRHFQFQGSIEARAAETKPPNFCIYKTCSAHTTTTHHRHLCTAHYCNSTYPANDKHTQMAPTIPELFALCTPMGRQSPNKYMLPIHPEWSDPKEEEKDLNKQESKEELEKEEEEDRDDTGQKEQELENDKSDSETMAPFENNTIKEDAPQLTNTLIGVLPTSSPEEEEQKDKQCDSDGSEFFEADSEVDSEIDNIV